MKRKRRIVSILMASMMLFSICGVPGYAGTDGIEPEEGGSVVTEKEPLPEKGKLTEYEEVSKTDKEAGESENVRSTDVETGQGELMGGTGAPGVSGRTDRPDGSESGDTSSGSGRSAISANSTGGTGGSVVKEEAEILANCSVKLMEGDSEKQGNFRETDTSVDVQVSLDESVESCYLNIYAYAGNTAFDPDSSYNVMLWSGRVTDGFRNTCQFEASALPLKKGYKVIASLNVPVGEDNYKPVNSQAIEVVDENGEGFTDYTYPDVTIDETELEAGATSIHISLTGDERIFEAARQGKTSVTCAIAQYPADEDFDFEGENQISLTSPITCTEAFSGKEVQLTEPLKAGYRVRAVVYWAQNEEIFLPKGNDYEEMFHMPDDSVLISGSQETAEPGAEIATPVTTASETVVVTLRGEIPEGSRILIKSFEEDEEIKQTGGTPVVSAQDVTEGENVLTPLPGTLEAGERLVVFLIDSSWDAIAQSEPVAVEKGADLVVTAEKPLTEGDTQATFNVRPAGSDITNLNIVSLCKTGRNGSADGNSTISTLYGQKPGQITFDSLAEDALKAGDKVYLSITYDNGDKTFESQQFTVSAKLADDSLAIRETQITTETGTITVEVAGCDDFRGGYLFLFTGAKSVEDDGDSGRRLGSASFTGAGSYSFDIGTSLLEEGNIVQPYLYIYDGDNDRTYYKYGNALTVTDISGQQKEARVEIATDSIRADREDVWVIADFDSRLTGTLSLYTYSSQLFIEETAEKIYSGDISPGETSQRISFGADKLTAGHRFIAVLELSDGTSEKSEAKVIQVVPEKQKPQVRILDETITAGDTQLKASLTFDSSVDEASYVLYQFEGETLDRDEAQVISEGSLYRSETNRTIYMGSGKLKEGASLQMILTADGQEAESNVMTVEPSPDWGQPYAAFDVAAVKADAETIPVTVDYSDEYLTLGDGFYCDVTIYQFPASYTDDEFEDGELWENVSIAQRVAQINSTTGAVTKGQIDVPVLENAELKAGDRLIIKLRLPHTEWEGEEVDYLFASVPVIGADDEVPDYKVVLYNLSGDTSRGERLRNILKELGIPAEDMTDDRLNETVGYLAGIDGYEAAGGSYDGEGSSQEFMLMCNLPESLLDRFLSAMMEAGLRIDHKAVVTEYNRDWQFHELIDDIGGEHDVFQALLALDDMITEAEKLKEAQYGTSPSWAAFREALDKAAAVLSGYEPSLSDLEKAREELKTQYLQVTGMTEISGTVEISIEADGEGTYMMTASLTEARAEASQEDYSFIWSDGTKGPVVRNVPADKLITMTVTVSSAEMFGKLTAALQVPDMPDVQVKAGRDSISLSWKAPTAAANKPLPSQYKAAVYDEDGTVVKERAVGGDERSVVIDGLESASSYTVKLWAVSPVGRSDMKVMAVSTVAAEEGTGAGDETTAPAQDGRPSGTGNGPAADETAEKPEGDTSAGDVARTGDESDAAAAVLALMLSAGVLTAVSLRRKTYR